ncbi:hypothetical protein [Acidihalobacter aeolianus]|uniref:hypothetical protein n=1 Tax=Acidihalobacter aeolianus TaxID=2792603 RepID=UPI000AFA988D|nr:hypothetical protein [Acidihalobacter aeolianus]
MTTFPNNPSEDRSCSFETETHSGAASQEDLGGAITQQRDRLMSLLYGPLRRIGMQCGQATIDGVELWSERSLLDNLLQDAFSSIPHCKYLYAMNREGVQISSSMSREGLISKHFERDRSDRPYMREALSLAGFLDKQRETHYQQWPYTEGGMQTVDFLLCDAYISEHALRPSMTAVYFVRDVRGNHIGFVGADFALRDLPQSRQIYQEPRLGRHFSGDAYGSITLSSNTRQDSKLDVNIDTVTSVIEELILFHGVHHVKLHFASGQTVLWQVDDPCRYRLMTVGNLIDPDSCLAYPKRPYPDNALIAPDEIRKILSQMKRLRNSDELLCLLTGSLNIFNGMVGVSFSSGSSHYVPHEDFLETDLSLWTSKNPY